MADPTTSELIALCERVLAADISREELQIRWPDDPEHAALAELGTIAPGPAQAIVFTELRETLFSGLEHLPGVRGSGPWRLDPHAWRATPEYSDIEFYLRRLREQR